MEHSQQYQLGSWIICPQTNTITNKADTHSIDNKSMQVLLFLIHHSGAHVTKGQILAHVWKGSFVADDILSVAVSKIRKALGDNARSPTFIKTLPGVGYTLISDVNKIEKPKQGRSKRIGFSSIYKPSITIGIITLLLIATFLAMYFINTDKGSAANRININSIAVLPFDDLSAKQDNQHFTDGLSDAIINQLSQIKSLKVISRYSSFTYRGKYNATEIGQALQVDTLLDGSVQTMGEQVRINVRIFSTKNGQQLWSKTFDSDTKNSFQLQDDISAAIQEIIQPGYVPIDGSPSSKPAKTINTQAYEWYLMGQYHWRQRNPKSLAKAVTYFKKSLELEPDYAAAHVGLGISYAFLHTYGDWYERRAIDAALPHIMTALTLKPNSPTALAAKGMILSDKAKAGLGELDSSLYQQAEQAFIRSLELDNNATTHRWYSTLLSRLGRESEAIKHLNKAIELNPLSASMKRSFSFLLKSMGKPDTAQRMYQRALSLEPDNFSHVIDSAKVNRHSQKSVMAMAAWQMANPEIFTTCSSVEYCEQLVLSYLSIGAHQAADKLLNKMRPIHGHLLHSINLIALSEKGDVQSVLSNIKRTVQHIPYSREAMFDLAVAQFRAANFSLAKTSLLQLYPEWRNKKSIVLAEITADNYMALVLYAATLSNLDEKEVAAPLLHKVQTFLKQDRVFDKMQAEFTLAEINAQLVNTPQALHHLTKALEMGWLESYHREWWSLQNNHLLRSLYENPEFKLLLKKHQEKLNELRGRLIHKLGTIPR
ncbi:MAG: winged helix-turn-helix domain-containing protein [Colwellia sp.]|nr:winged helix-turn-helix domain-containing protein [Colwellia sp.]